MRARFHRDVGAGNRSGSGRLAKTIRFGRTWKFIRTTPLVLYRFATNHAIQERDPEKGDFRKDAGRRPMRGAIKLEREPISPRTPNADRTSPILTRLPRYLERL